MKPTRSPIPKRIQLMTDEEVQRGYLCNAASSHNQQLANHYLREANKRKLRLEHPNLCGGHPNLCGGGSGHVPGTPKGE